MTSDRAKIIAFLGIDGAGKSTQAHLTADWLSELGASALYHRNEGARSELDKLARRHGRRDIADLLGSENAAYAQAAVRWKSICSVRDAMAQPGTYVIMDRYIYCQYAAAVMQGLPMAIMRVLFAEFPPADIAFFLGIDPAEARDRIERRGVDSDSIELLRASTTDTGRCQNSRTLSSSTRHARPARFSST